jgi:hypothetical protein
MVVPLRPTAMKRLAVLVCGTAVVLVGCAHHARPSVHSIALTTYRGLPPGVHFVRVPEAQAQAVRQGADRLALTLWGSGSCPWVPTAANAIGPTEVRVTVRTVVPSGTHRVCTADLSPTTSVIALAPTTSTSGSLTVSLIGLGAAPVRLVARPQ